MKIRRSASNLSHRVPRRLKLRDALLICFLGLLAGSAVTECATAAEAPLTAPPAAPPATAPGTDADPPAALAAVLARKAANKALFEVVERGDLPAFQKLAQADPTVVRARDYWGQSVLISALQRGDKNLPLVQFLLENGADANEVGYYGATPLATAVASGSENLLRLLLKSGAKINGNPVSPLFSAVTYYKPELLDVMVKAGADVNARNANGENLLHVAAHYSDLEKFKYLVGLGVDLKGRDNQGKTPLFKIAFSVMSTQIYRNSLEFAVAHGADINARARDGNSLLVQAVLDHDLSLNVDRVGVLLDLGIDPNLVNYRGDLALHVALRRSTIYDDIVAKLVDKSNLKLKDQHGFTPLMLALLYDHPHARKMILEAQPITDEVDDCFDAAAQNDLPRLKKLLLGHPYLARARLSDGTTALHLAAMSARLDTVRALIEAGADPNSRDALARTPLHRAIRAQLEPARQTDERQVIAALLNRKANPAVADQEDLTPLHLAARLGLVAEGTQLVTALVQQGLPLDTQDKLGSTPLLACLQSTVKKGDAAAFARLLLARGSDPRSANTEGDTALSRAVTSNNPEVLSLLVDKGLALDELVHGDSLVALAVENSALDALTFLLDHGLKPEGPGIKKSLISRAIWNSQDAMATLLIERGADVNARFEESDTPLTRAINSDRRELVRQLLNHKADPNLPNRDGKTPLQLALEYNRQPLAELLRQRGAKEPPAMPPAP